MRCFIRWRGIRLKTAQEILEDAADTDAPVREVVPENAESFMAYYLKKQGIDSSNNSFNSINSFFSTLAKQSGIEKLKEYGENAVIPVNPVLTESEEKPVKPVISDTHPPEQPTIKDAIHELDLKPIFDSESSAECEIYLIRNRGNFSAHLAQRQARAFREYSEMTDQQRKERNYRIKTTAEEEDVRDTMQQTAKYLSYIRDVYFRKYPHP